jgi:hypothetical protein
MLQLIGEADRSRGTPDLACEIGKKPFVSVGENVTVGAVSHFQCSDGCPLVGEREANGRWRCGAGCCHHHGAVGLVEEESGVGQTKRLRRGPDDLGKQVRRTQCVLDVVSETGEDGIWVIPLAEQRAADQALDPVADRLEPYGNKAGCDQ